MNKTFKTVWNQARRCLVAVNETVRRASQSRNQGGSSGSCARKLQLTALAGVVALAMGASASYAKYVTESDTAGAGNFVFYISFGQTEPGLERTSIRPQDPLGSTRTWAYDEAKSFWESENAKADTGGNLKNSILVNITLDMTSHPNFDLPYTMGFKATKGLTSIIGNSELALIGETENPDFLMTDSPLSVGGSTDEGHGTLYLGHIALPDADQYGGVVNIRNIRNNSALHVVAGNYRIANPSSSMFNELEDNSFIKVYEGASLSFNGGDLSVSSSGYIVNYGTLTVEDGIRAASSSATGEAPLRNYGTLNFYVNGKNSSGFTQLAENNGVFNYVGPVDYDSINLSPGEYTYFLKDVKYEFYEFKGTGTLNIDGAMRVRKFNAADYMDLNVNGALRTDNLIVKNLVNDGTILANAYMTSYGSVENNGDLYVRDRLRALGRVDNKGLLYLDEALKLENTAHLHNAATGTINVPYEYIFSKSGSGSATLNTIGIAETAETIVKPVPTSYFAEGTVGGALLDIIKNNSSWDDGGTLIVRFDQYDGVSQTILEGAFNDFKKTFGEGTTLSYEGTFGTASGSSVSSVFNVSALNTLYSKESALRGVIYVDRSLTGEGKEIRIGDASGSLNNSTGFTAVIDSPKVWVEAGKELALIGEKSDVSTERTTVAQNINVTGKNAKLTLGSLGLKDASQYRTNLPTLKLEDKGLLNIVTGDHVITNFESTNGLASVGQGATLHIQNSLFNEEASFDNYGNTTFGKLNGNFLTHVNNNGKMVVDGETRFSGWIKNSDRLQFKGNTTVVGTLQNNAGGEIYAKTVNVIGSLVNNGYMEAKDDSTVNGRIENPGTIILYSVNINKGDTTLNGTVQNSHKLVGTGVANINGLLKNAPGAVATFNDENSIVNINEGGEVTNAGVLIAKTGEIQGSLQTTDIAVLDNVKGTASSSIAAKGTLMADSFSTDGVVMMSKDADLVIGGAPSRTKYLLSNLAVAKRIFDAGGEIPLVVMEALQNQGVRITPAETQADAPVKMLRRGVRKAEVPAENMTEVSNVAESEPVVLSEEPAVETQSEATAEDKAVKAEQAAKKDKERASVLVAPQPQQVQPVQIIQPSRLVPSIQGAVASMSIASMTQDAGFLEERALTKGDGLWADVGTGNIEFDGYKGTRSGLFFGGQANINNNVLVGGAIRYTDGRIKGNNLHKNDWTGYGFGLYGSYTNDGWFGLATALYQNNRAKDIGRIKSDSQALSVKGGKSVQVKNFTVTPYVGYRMIHVNNDKAEKATVHQIPVGVKVQGNAKAGAWHINPSIDVAFVPQLGDRKISLKGTGFESTIASRYAGEARIGISASKGKFGAGLHYVGSAGDNGLRSHSIQARVNYSF